jgi:hypothetical protein
MKNFKNICFCCVFVLYSVHVLLFSNPCDDLSLHMLWFGECLLYAKALVICFGFNMHKLIARIPCSLHHCRLVDFNSRRTFEHTWLCIPRNCEDLSLLNIHMYASFIHLPILHVCTIHEFLNLELAQRPLEAFC